MYRTLQEATEAKINERINDVKFWIEYGLTKEEAIAKVRATSIMGEKVWERIAQSV